MRAWVDAGFRCDHPDEETPMTTGARRHAQPGDLLVVPSPSHVILDSDIHAAAVR
jgi:hypothetical protein